MRYKLTLIALSLLATAAQAQNIVYPPQMPGPTAGAAAPTPTMPAATPAVRPDPAPATQPPAAQAGVLPPDALDLVLPAPPEKPAVDLTPSAPAEKAATVPATPARKSNKPKTKRTPVREPYAETEAASMDDPFVGIVSVPVSDANLNQFYFPEPILGVYFPEGAPLPDCPENAKETDPCKPVFINGRRGMLLQLRAGAQGPIQMLVHLYSGTMKTIYLSPMRGPGAIARIDGAEDGPSDKRLADSRHSPSEAGASAAEQDTAFLARFARGDIPAGYESRLVGQAMRYDLFDTQPLATWSNGTNSQVRLLQVRALDEHPVAINNGLFRNANTRAIALSTDTITNKAPALLYILERIGQ